ncbi:MAG TPA: nodulation protein NfeD [Bacteroidota bacterium]|nr:nodulation protein NfeD [Bacteroidota bacterium]
MKPFICIIALFLFTAAHADADVKPIHILTIDGAITPATADYLHEGIARATDKHAQCVIIEINTPGGLLKATRMIVTDFLTADVPIVAYVSPQGAQAASAGVFITLAAHVAVMAPGTNIGAAHPVSTQGQMDSVMSGKVTNDAAAFIRTISEKRKRNVQWAEDAVRKSVSITEREALANHIIDFTAITRRALLDSLNGRTIQLDTRAQRLETIDAPVEDHPMGWQYRLLNMLSDPNVSYILFMIGIYGLFFELYNPGAIFPGVVGAIALILALYSFQTMPVNYAGLALILVGIVLFILEIKIISHGVLTIGGIAALFFGSIMLFKAESEFDMVSVSLAVIIPAVLTTAAFFALAVGAGIRAQTRKVAIGSDAMIGLTGVAITDINPAGQVRVQGEIWNADTEGSAIAKDAEIVITGMRGLRCIVTVR